ncbi:MAG: ABC transporter substrate-binding protein [Dehalococcoidia bacterium]
MQEQTVRSRSVGRRRALQLGGIGLAGAGSLWLLACGGGGAKKEAASSTVGAGAAQAGRAGAAVAGVATQTAEKKFKPGGRFVSSFTQGMTVLDPHQERISYHLQAFNKLLKTPADGKLTNDLAASYEQPDPQTYIFKLPAEIPFHNIDPVNGRNMTAEDVAYSFKRMLTPKPEYQKKYYFDRMKSIEAVDKQTVKLTTDGPYSPQLGYVGATHAVIVPQEAVEKFGDLRNNVIGTGPFMMTDYKHQVSYSFKKHPKYFKKDLPYLDEVELLRIADQATAISRFRSKQLDVVATSGRDAKQLRGAGFQEFESDGNGYTIRPNVTKAPFNDPRVRRALHLLIDRKQIIDLVLAGAGYNFADLPRYFTAAIKPDELAKMPGYRQPKTEDIAEAKKLLEAAGVGKGFSFETISYVIDMPDVVQVLRSQLQPHGIQVTNRAMEFSEWTTLVLEKKFDAMITSGSQRDEADEYYYAVYHTKGARNDTGISDPKIDAMLLAQQQEVVPEKRDKLLRDISLSLLEAPVWIPLYVGITFDFEQSDVRNLQRGSINYWHFLLEQTAREQ